MSSKGKTQNATKSTPMDHKETEHSTTELNALMVSVDLLDPDPNNPRTMEFSEEDQPTLEELAESIKSVGIISPLTITKVGERYKVLAGHRRTLAAKMAGLKEVPAVIHKEETPERSLVIQLVENIQRQNLPLKDLYVAVSKLKHEHGWNATRIAKELGRSRSWSTFILSVAEGQGLAKKAVEEGLISDMKRAYEFNTLPEKTQSAIYESAKKSGETIKQSAIEIAKNPPAIQPVDHEPVVDRQPTQKMISLPAEAFNDDLSDEDRPQSPNVIVSRESDNLSVSAPLDNFVRFLKSLGRPVDTDEQITKGIVEILS